MNKLRVFEESIRLTKSVAAAGSNDNNNNSSGDVDAECYHGQLLEKDEEEREDRKKSINNDLENWHIGKLKCKKHIDDNYRNNDTILCSDGRTINDYAVLDPRKSRKT